MQKPSLTGQVIHTALSIKKTLAGALNGTRCVSHFTRLSLSRTQPPALVSRYI